MDFSSATEAVVGEAARLAKVLPAKVVVLAGIQPPMITSEYAALMENSGEILAAGEKNAARRLTAIENQLKAAGVAYKIGKYPFTADPRSRANGATEGFVKVLADKASDRVLGVHIIGADAGNMIAEAAVAMEFGASSEDIARTCHAHPTLPEAVKEAALAVSKRAIHM